MQYYTAGCSKDAESHTCRDSWCLKHPEVARDSDMPMQPLTHEEMQASVQGEAGRDVGSRPRGGPLSPAFGVNTAITDMIAVEFSPNYSKK